MKTISNCARSAPRKKKELFQFEIIFIELSKQFQIEIVALFILNAISK